jgi:hypothetical protein
MFNADEFYNEYTAFKNSNSCKNLIIDFSEAVPYSHERSQGSFDSSVVAILTQFHDEVKRRGGRFKFMMYETHASILSLRSVGSIDAGKDTPIKENLRFLKNLEEHLELINPENVYA